ncbi:transposase zinc-binding domain-containing protein, partial [Myxococcus sp. AB022]
GWAYRRRQPEGTVLYEAVRENLATLLAEASDVGRGLPRYVERDFARYLECGVLVHGFARVRCESCKDELLVAFSCKGRGGGPSCNAKRAQVTAVHLVERVLPHVPYRQWTLSFPHRVRWVLLKEKGLLSDVLTLFLRAVFALQRRRARRQGVRGGQTGAVSFLQFFGSALQVTPHYHALVPEGVFAPGARLRPFLVPQAGEQEASAGLEAAAGKERVKERTPRVDFRRVAQEDVRLRRVRLREVWRQAAGVGEREGGPRGAGDCGAPGLAHGMCEVGPGTRATPGRVVLRLKTATRPAAPATHLMGARPGQACAP